MGVRVRCGGGFWGDGLEGAVLCLVELETVIKQYWFLSFFLFSELIFLLVIHFLIFF